MLACRCWGPQALGAASTWMTARWRPLSGAGVAARLTRPFPYLTCLLFAVWPFGFLCQNAVERLDGLILIGPGVAKRCAVSCEFPSPNGSQSFLRLGLLEGGARLYAAAQCRGLLRCKDEVFLVAGSVLRDVFTTLLA